jgi:cytochrome c biogenesis protein ResB
VIILLLGELVTGLYAIEGSMTIDEGATCNFVDVHRTAELAIIDPDSSGEENVVTVIPDWMLQKKGQRISNEQLPFDVEVVQYMPNSALRDITTGDIEKARQQAAPATNGGAGLQFTAVEVGESSGASSDQKMELPSAYLTFYPKDSDTPIGTYLMTAHLRSLQVVTVDGKNYDVALRLKRSYKPYSIHLYQFRFDRYPGTTTAKNFSSLVRLVDREQNVDRVVLIRMNEPLRHRGETFYQQSFEKSEKTTILQVVRNPGWLMPYISCTVVSLGMLLHFGISLATFQRRRTVS